MTSGHPIHHLIGPPFAKKTNHKADIQARSSLNQAGVLQTGEIHTKRSPPCLEKGIGGTIARYGPRSVSRLYKPTARTDRSSSFAS